MKSKPVFNWNSIVRSAIRRAFARSPKVISLIDDGKRKVPHYNKDGSRSKVDRVEINCQICDSWVRAKLFSGVDHIIPVISIEDGFVDWNTYIDRVDCDSKNLQRVCKVCHDKKTQAERIRRNIIKYNGAMDILEHILKAGQLTKEYAKALKKIISKYKTKTRPQVIRERAIKLLAVLLEKTNV